MLSTARMVSLASLLFTLTTTAFAADIVVKMNTVADNGTGKDIGTITFSAGKPCGIVITPNLHDLTPGTHGFHIHEHPSCADKAMAAGGHMDPAKTNAHEGPYQDKGHLGDMPVLVVDKNGSATLPTSSPRLTMNDIKGHAIMIHMGSDNYSDIPEKLGGGGARIACGVAE